MYFSVKNSSGQAVIRHVTLYKVVGSQLNFIDEGDTKTVFRDNYYNGACDILDSNGSTGTYSKDIKIWNPLLNWDAADYVIVIEDNYLRIYLGDNYDINIYYRVGIGFQLDSLSGNRPHTVRHTGSFSQTYSLSFNNDFEDGLSGGLVYFDGGAAKTAPYNTTLAKWTWGHTAAAYTPQTAGGFTRKFYQWNNQFGFYNSNSYLNPLPMSSDQYSAKFNKYYDVVIENQLPGYSNQVQITVESVTQNSPYNLEIIRAEPFTSAGILQYIESIKFTFSHWLKNGQTTGETSPFTPTANNTYTAVYTAKPWTWNRALNCNSPIG